MNTHLQHIVAQEQYKDQVRIAQRQVLSNQVNTSNPRILRASARILATLLLATAERLHQYSENTEAALHVSQSEASM